MIDPTNPLKNFDLWYKEACSHPNIKEPAAMTVATATKDGAPSARILLLRDYSEEGFVFYTNLTSRKSNELKENKNVALCFYWMPIDKQVRITGKVQKISEQQADQYFARRPRESQISAWASKQSMHLDNYQTFEKRIEKITKDFEGKEVPRPPFWSGYRLVPEQIEFWIAKEFRRHERYLFTKYANGWQHELLYP